MSHPQSAIIPDHAQAGIFIEADISDGRNEDIKSACRLSLEALAKLKTRFPNDILGLTIAFGSRAWQSFGHTDEGSEIKPFPELGNGLAPSTQHDLYIHIQATEQKAAYALAQSVLGAFGDSIRVATEACACMKTAAWTVLSMVRKIRRAMTMYAMLPSFPKASPMPAAAMFCCKNTCTI